MQQVMSSRLFDSSDFPKYQSRNWCMMYNRESTINYHLSKIISKLRFLTVNIFKTNKKWENKSEKIILFNKCKHFLTLNGNKLSGNKFFLYNLL